MPFILKKTDSPQRGTWTYIPMDQLIKLRDKFIQRHKKLIEAGGPDYSSDFNPIVIDSQFFNDIVQAASLGHYLVAQYIGVPDHKTLSLALSIKEKSPIPGQNDTKIGVFFDVKGTYISEEDCNKYHTNYLVRRALCTHFVPDFAHDREGRAHEIVHEMKDAVNKMRRNSAKIYAYFILDDTIGGVETLSIVFSDTEILSPIDSVVKIDLERIYDAYDHGAACCPIG